MPKVAKRNKHVEKELQEISDKIKDVFRKRIHELDNISQSDLAKIMGCTRANISAVLSPTFILSLRSILDLSKALGLEFDIHFKKDKNYEGRLDTNKG